MKKITPIFSVLLLSLMTVTLRAEEPQTPPEGTSRLFIFSGQSNMEGFNPNDVFIPELQKAFPQDKIVWVKDAENGQPIRRWFVKEQTRDLYKRLFAKVEAETEKQSFDSVTFIWMQGEADASWAEDSGRYEANITGLIQKLRDDLDNQNMTVVIGRISSAFSGTLHGDKVREAQVAVAKADPLVAWIDTDDISRPPDNVHYNKEGKKVLGARFAGKAIELLKTQEK